MLVQIRTVRENTIPMFRILTVVFICLCCAPVRSSYGEIPNSTEGQSQISIGKAFFPEFLHPAFDALEKGDADLALKLLYHEIKLIDSDSRERFSRIASEPKIYLLKALVLKAKGESNQALALLDKAIALTPGSAEVHLEKAHVLNALGKKDEAIDAYKDAIWFRRIGGVIDSAHLELAKLYLEKDLKPEARVELQSALASNPSDVVALRMLSNLELQAGNKAAGVKALRDALSANPTSPELKIELAKAILMQTDRLSDQGDLKEVNVLAEELLSASADQSIKREATLLLINSDIMLGSLDLAEKQLVELARINSKDPEIPRLKKQIAIERAAAANVPEDGNSSPNPEENP